MARARHWQRRQRGCGIGGGRAGVAARRQQRPAGRRWRQLRRSATAVLPLHFLTRCHCRQSCCCRRASRYTATADKVALPPSFAPRCQADRCHRHQAATAALQQLRCHSRTTAVYTADGLPLPTPPPRCRRRRHRCALAKLPPPPPSWTPSPSLCHHISAAAVAFISNVIIVCCFRCHCRQ